MNPFNNSKTIEQLLARFTGPVRKIRTMLFVRENGQKRIVQDKQDQTEIDPSGSIDTVVSHEGYFHDCGHLAADNLGGKCECGALVCAACLTHCGHCGASLCPKHRKQDMESDTPLCPPCYREAVAKRRLKKVAASVTSFFVKQEKKG